MQLRYCLMQYEKSCGGVVFTRKGNDIHYVIIQHLGGHWGFPKGHMEPGEDEKTTALREIREEIGVCAVLKDGFRIPEEYPLPRKPGVTKQVVYFLAEYSGQKIQYQKEELKAACLLPYEEAMKRLTFAETKRILAEAKCFLEG